MIRTAVMFAVATITCGSAFAQSASSPPSSAQTQAAQGATQQPLPQKIQQKLAAHGFTDIKVVPEGYIVTAKDKDGDPVTMVIGPNSIAMFSVSPSTSQSSGNQSTSSGTASVNR